VEDEMSAEWDSGFMVRQPSWHRLEKAVLKQSPRTWEEARTLAGLDWEAETAPVYTLESVQPKPDGEELKVFRMLEGWQQIRRNDTQAVLSVRPESYRIIPNAEFGKVIDEVLAIEDDEHVEFEALMSLYGGRQIVALVYFSTPLVMPWDNSPNFTFCALNSRHDGNGGLRFFPTNVRVQCANTLNLAEMTDGRTYGRTIRHTANWEERISELRQEMIAARGDGQRWVEFSEQLALWKTNARQEDSFLKRVFPVSDENGSRKNDNQLENRAAVRTVLAGSTCEQIRGTGYGLLMATTEWSDHYRTAQTPDTYVSRQLLRVEEPKAKAVRVLRQMASIKV
jgi:phage/plasmid-like protein (TIGR03299 family)